jgi:hypothetical protein
MLLQVVIDRGQLSFALFLRVLVTSWLERSNEYHEDKDTKKHQEIFAREAYPESMQTLR